VAGCVAYPTIYTLAESFNLIFAKVLHRISKMQNKNSKVKYLFLFLLGFGLGKLDDKLN